MNGIPIPNHFVIDADPGYFPAKRGPLPGLDGVGGRKAKPKLVNALTELLHSL
jgi:hypothetical protein